MIANAGWGPPTQRGPVPPVSEGSREARLPVFSGAEPEGPPAERGHRATGVVHDPGFGRRGNHVPTVLPRRYAASPVPEGTRAPGPVQSPPIGEPGAPDAFPSGGWAAIRA